MHRNETCTLSARAHRWAALGVAAVLGWVWTQGSLGLSLGLLLGLHAAMQSRGSALPLGCTGGGGCAGAGLDSGPALASALGCCCAAFLGSFFGGGGLSAASSAEKSLKAATSPCMRSSRVSRVLSSGSHELWLSRRRLVSCIVCREVL